MEELRTVLAEKILKEKREVDEKVTIQSLGINSIEYIKIVVMLEQKFDIEFDDDDLVIDTNITLGELMQKIEQIIMEKQAQE